MTLVFSSLIFVLLTNLLEAFVWFKRKGVPEIGCWWPAMMKSVLVVRLRLMLLNDGDACDLDAKDSCPLCLDDASDAKSVPDANDDCSCANDGWVAANRVPISVWYQVNRTLIRFQGLMNRCPCRDDVATKDQHLHWCHSIRLIHCRQVHRASLFAYDPLLDGSETKFLLVALKAATIGPAPFSGELLCNVTYDILSRVPNVDNQCKPHGIYPLYEFCLEIKTNIR